MDKLKILVVDDESRMRKLVKDFLVKAGYDVIEAGDGEQAVDTFYAQKDIALIILDVMMPKMDGFEMVRRIRQTDKQTPVLFLTARSAINDVVEGFELGANDYLKKPFGMAELIVRIKALLHKVSVQRPEATSFRIGLYTFDSITQTLVYRGEKQLLSNRESEILKRLCDNKDQVLPMKEILIDLWGDDSFFNARSLHVFITKLRHKLSKDESIKILNIRGIGYKLIID